MSLTTTTASSAISLTDTAITVASTTGFAVGNYVRVDQEFMIQTAAASGSSIPVARGRLGTATAAHVASANVVTGLPSDLALPIPGSADAPYPTVRGRTITSYSASGAITLPTPGSDAVAILNGTSALAMTLANPTKDQDGDILTIIGNGKSTSTITYSAGLGNAGGSYDVLTLPSGGQVALQVMAANGIWVALGPMTGTLTAIGGAIA